MQLCQILKDFRADFCLKLWKNLHVGATELKKYLGKIFGQFRMLRLRFRPTKIVAD